MLLRVVFNRLDEVFKKHQKYDEKQSYTKFTALRELYSLIRESRDNVEQLFNKIRAWDNSHKLIIDDYRGFHFNNCFFKSKTATRKMLNELYGMQSLLQTIQKLPDNNPRTSLIQAIL